jgi:hypothetical protein
MLQRDAVSLSRGVLRLVSPVRYGAVWHHVYLHYDCWLLVSMMKTTMTMNKHKLETMLECLFR